MDKVPDSSQKALLIFCYLCCKPSLIYSQIKDFFKRKESKNTKEMKIVEKVLWTEFWKYNKKIKKAKTQEERDSINAAYSRLFDEAKKEIEDLKK